MTDGLRNRLGGLWEELKQRRVIRTTIVYVVGASILIEVASFVFPALLLPEWSIRILTIIAILALPLVVALAWMFDIERSPVDASDEDSKINVTLKPAVATDQSNVPPMLTSAIASVAVLPFENLSDDKEFGYVADGIAMELHGTLAKVHRLRVAARTSTFATSRDNADVRDIARKLNVKFVISGSVRCVGKHMRVFVELDNAVEGVQIWSEIYDRDVGDLFSVQHDIAYAVASEFGGARLREEIVSAARYPTANLDAWSLVQRARCYVLEFTPDALMKAVPLFRQAIDLDANYAAAHAALASSLSELILNGLAIDSETDKIAALESADKAISQSPGDPFVLKMCGAVWAIFGNTRDSLRALSRAVEIAPFNFGAWGYMGWPLVETGKAQSLEKLHEIMERIIQATPNHPGVPYWQYHKSAAYTCEGAIDDAVRCAQQSVEQNPTYPWGWMHYANALGLKGDTRGAKRAIQRCHEISPALTPDYFERMLFDMSDNETFIERRVAGLKNL